MQINKVQVIDSATEADLKHLPKIELPEEYELDSEVEVTVSVGYIPHPMSEEHGVKWIELYKNDQLIKNVLISSTEEPVATFKTTLDGSDKLTARAECNLHGVWESEKMV